MKKIFKTVMVFSLVFFTACDDYIEVEPVGPDADNYFNNEQEYESALIGAYDMLQSSFWNVLLGVIASDDYAAGGDSFNYDQPTLQNVNQMIHTPSDNNQLRDIWNLMYAGLNRANYLLEFKDKTDFSGREQIIAQAYFLRAYYAFELAKHFGDIPLKTEERNGVSRIADQRTIIGEQYDINRVGSISAVYSLIEEDLKEAIPNLPLEQSEVYKVSKGAAQALLGKVYLYHGTFDADKFADAASAFADVIGSEQYSLKLEEDYQNLFESSAENGTESVFEIQYTGVEPAGWNCIICSEGSYFPKFCGPRSPYDNQEFVTGWGFCLPSQELYDLYDEDDARRDVTIYDLRDQQDSYSQGRDDTGLFNRKYIPRKADDRAGSDPLNFANNYRSIRYADVLLMSAEAEAQSGGANAENRLNDVRFRAYGDNSHDYTAAEGDILDAIYLERRKELAGEGHRFFDLVRTGQAAAAIPGFIANKNEVFPIPLVELELANAVGRWGQNQGY